MNLQKVIPLFLLGICSTTYATLISDKVTLKPNMVIDYNKAPSATDNFLGVFTDGMLYGRLRTNLFQWDWKDPNNFDNKALGVGGSLIYKTAPYSGISATLGLYTSQAPAWFRESSSDVGNVKAGKDTFSRYNVEVAGDYGMNVVGQAYLQYQKGQTVFKAGRLMFESLYTASNDTKMIPNTFDGIVMTTRDIPQSTLRVAYLDKQKLRDHTNSHDVIAYRNATSPISWSQNDDSGVNKNLTVARIGNNNDLFITTLLNKSVRNLRVQLNYMSVPNVVSNAAVESHYAFDLTKEVKIIPGFRYMQQFDNLHANYGVANLGADQQGYTNPNSLESHLTALRLDLKGKVFLVRLGYSEVADEADIIAPWRGFPTAGFTRAMAQYNWYANTKTYAAKLSYDFGKARLLDGFSVMARYAIQDFDDSKDGVQSDSNVLHIDLRQNISDSLEAKLRLGFVDSKNDTLKSDGITFKNDVSYSEYRFELNYFF